MKSQEAEHGEMSLDGIIYTVLSKNIRASSVQKKRSEVISVTRHHKQNSDQINKPTVNDANGVPSSW
jgi:hypothetical protein